ncbi:MAG TPA: prepilin-type N-terminal cleavage/methylation domain-containing protein [Oligoflexia bacterium]|nr:prepilin-type N-terminal cleavage/methylation domain-containing protein [Oligoflexia bacterium]
MQEDRFLLSRAVRDGGFTFLELLVSLLLSGVVVSGLYMQLRTSIERARDHQIRLETFVQAQAVAQTIAAEIRMAGNGVPFDQKNFFIGAPNLSDNTVTEPIVVSDTSASKIALRVNEAGEVFLLAASFDPASSATISLNDVSLLEENDPIYISNSVVSGDDGLYAQVASVNSASNTITIDSDYVASPGAVFAAGSTLEEVPVVTYESVNGTITRDSGFGPVFLAENGTLTLEYLDIDGNALNLPLQQTDLVNALRSARITITLSSPRKMSTGETYAASVSQVIGIRNLDYLF